MFPVKNIILVLIFVVGVVILQIFLSKKENKWLGLFLPLIIFTYSMIVVLGYVEMTTTDKVLSAIMIFIQHNIPTLILLGIYVECRQNFKKDKKTIK